MNILHKTSGGVSLIPLETKQMSRRMVSIFGEINEDVAMDFAAQILELNLESDAPITVQINSPGGQVGSGLLMCDVIVDSPAPIRMVCMEKAYSMGAVLFACAKERLMLPNSKLMLHQPLLGGVSGNASSIKSISDSLWETKQKLNRLIAVKTGKTEQEIDEATAYDHFFSPEEAIDFGLCDRMVQFSEIVGFAKNMED